MISIWPLKKKQRKGKIVTSTIHRLCTLQPPIGQVLNPLRLPFPFNPCISVEDSYRMGTFSIKCFGLTCWRGRAFCFEPRILVKGWEGRKPSYSLPLYFKAFRQIIFTLVFHTLLPILNTIDNSFFYVVCYYFRVRGIPFWCSQFSLAKCPFY